MQLGYRGKNNYDKEDTQIVWKQDTHKKVFALKSIKNFVVLCGSCVQIDELPLKQLSNECQAADTIADAGTQKLYLKKLVDESRKRGKNKVKEKERVRQ